MNYKDGKTLFKIYAKLKELRLVYYMDVYGIVLIQWQRDWTPYDEVMKFDKRLELQ